ncbi:hypothetical protein B0H13DRAFT_2335715 [Mycena leptocephala]|nr:hypothetical protein B0H13DRAFT_2335715 [Mycena leptocephala]
MDVYSAIDILGLGPRVEDKSMWTNAERVEVWMSFLDFQDGLIMVLWLCRLVYAIDAPSELECGGCLSHDALRVRQKSAPWPLCMPTLLAEPLFSTSCVHTLRTVLVPDSPLCALAMIWSARCAPILHLFGHRLLLCLVRPPPDMNTRTPPQASVAPDAYRSSTREASFVEEPSTHEHDSEATSPPSASYSSSPSRRAPSVSLQSPTSHTWRSHSPADTPPPFSPSRCRGSVVSPWVSCRLSCASILTHRPRSWSSPASSSQSPTPNLSREALHGSLRSRLPLPRLGWADDLRDLAIQPYSPPISRHRARDVEYRLRPDCVVVAPGSSVASTRIRPSPSSILACASALSAGRVGAVPDPTYVALGHHLIRIQA